jgi:tRNA-2-methylthio-N6-dimethylallyladenosine synthase
LKLEDAIPDEEKARRLEVLMAKQREIQTINYKKYIGSRCEVMIEGKNEARSQLIGRTTHNKTLNFTAPANALPKPGSYAQVAVTGSFPNSLLGELVI